MSFRPMTVTCVVEDAAVLVARVGLDLEAALVGEEAVARSFQCALFGDILGETVRLLSKRGRFLEPLSTRKKQISEFPG